MSYVYNITCIAFRLFQSSSSQAKMVNDYDIQAISDDIEHQPQENIFNYFLHYSFLWNLH